MHYFIQINQLYLNFLDARNSIKEMVDSPADRDDTQIRVFSFGSRMMDCSHFHWNRKTRQEVRSESLFFDIWCIDARDLLYRRHNYEPDRI